MDLKGNCSLRLILIDHFSFFMHIKKRKKGLIPPHNYHPPLYFEIKSIPVIILGDHKYSQKLTPNFLMT